MKIIVRARYKKLPKFGYICICAIDGMEPKEYQLKIFEEKKGRIETMQKSFPSVDKARGHAALYGFLLSEWILEEREI